MSSRVIRSTMQTCLARSSKIQMNSSSVASTLSSKQMLSSLSASNSSSAPFNNATTRMPQHSTNDDRLDEIHGDMAYGYMMGDLSSKDARRTYTRIMSNNVNNDVSAPLGRGLSKLQMEQLFHSYDQLVVAPLSSSQTKDDNETIEQLDLLLQEQPSSPPSNYSYRSHPTTLPPLPPQQQQWCEERAA